jgi:NCAIR mutase (PurE)-related protein
MDPQWLRDLLEQVQTRDVTIDEALSRLRGFPYEDLGFARLDSHRTLRRGFPEVVFCPGKTTEQIVRIVQAISMRDGRLLAARAGPEVAEAVQAVLPQAVYHPAARMIVVGEPAPRSGRGTVVVVTAGTADIPVAEEAAVTASTLGSPVEELFDVGVAGIHRLFDNREKLFSANVLVVVAGMEGALASVVAGLVDRPVVAVPTSIGYGASLGGISALLTMLNSCSPGVATVNIDNGFGAGYLAHLINQ